MHATKCGSWTLYWVSPVLRHAWCCMPSKLLLSLLSVSMHAGPQACMLDVDLPASCPHAWLAQQALVPLGRNPDQDAQLQGQLKAQLSFKQHQLIRARSGEGSHAPWSASLSCPIVRPCHVAQHRADGRAQRLLCAQHVLGGLQACGHAAGAAPPIHATGATAHGPYATINRPRSGLCGGSGTFGAPLG